MENSSNLELTILKSGKYSFVDVGGLEILLKKSIENVFSSKVASTAYILGLRDLSFKLNVFNVFFENIISSVYSDEDKENLKRLLSNNNVYIPKNLSYVNAPTFALAYEFLYSIFETQNFDFNINDMLVSYSLRYYTPHVKIIGSFLPFDKFMHSLNVDLKKLTDAIIIDVFKEKSFFGREYSFNYSVKQTYIRELEEYFDSDFVKMHINHNLNFTVDFLSLLPVLFVDFKPSQIYEEGSVVISKFKGKVSSIKTSPVSDENISFNSSFKISYPNIPYILRFKTGFKRIAHLFFPNLRDREIYNLLLNSFEDNIVSIEKAYQSVFETVNSRVNTAYTAISFAKNFFDSFRVENDNAVDEHNNVIFSALNEIESLRSSILLSEKTLNSIEKSFFISVLKEYLGDDKRFFDNSVLERVRSFYNDLGFLKFLETKLKEKISFENLDFYTDNIISLFGLVYTSLGVNSQPEILNAMIEKVDEIDAFKGHSSRVGDLFYLLSSEYKNFIKNTDKFKYNNDFFEFDDDTLKLIGSLHDIGKLFVRTEILKKPFRLSESEFFEVQQHTVFGFKLLDSMNLDDVFKLAALYHHKNFSSDGFGGNYPSSEGFYDFITDIPYSNIISLLRIVDSIDAISASFIDRDYDKKRFYKSRTVVDAVSVVKKEFGSTFNPLFEKFFYEKGEDVILDFYRKLYSVHTFSEGLLAIETYISQ